MATPHSAGDEPPLQPLPAGAYDCHMHLFDTAFPFDAGATLRHAPASADDYRQLQARLGSEQCVLVQPSSYGVDHRVLLAGLQALGAGARGIAVVTPDVSDSELQTLSAHGVVGARFNLVQRGVTHESMLTSPGHRQQVFVDGPSSLYRDRG